MPTDPAELVLEVRGAAKRFRAKQALGGVDLTLRAGEIYALIGPNGAGKTTLVRSICGRYRLDAGTVRVLGADPRGDRDVRRRIGLVPQEVGLYAELTVRENLALLGTLAGVARADLPQAIELALDWSGLSSSAQELAGNLSGGMQRRLNLAAGTLHRPRLLLLDEPTVGIDPGARESIHELLGALRESRIAILLTTHDLEQAEALSDRIGILIDGRLCAEGDLEGLVRDTFGEAKELTVTLAAEPDARGASCLEREGLERAPRDRTWCGKLRGGLAQLSALGARMSDEGLAVAEVRVREPGLRGVFFRLTGRELAP